MSEDLESLSFTDLKSKANALTTKYSSGVDGELKKQIGLLKGCLETIGMSNDATGKLRLKARIEPVLQAGGKFDDDTAKDSTPK